jgi:hypothetical protein
MSDKGGLVAWDTKNGLREPGFRNQRVFYLRKKLVNQSVIGRHAPTSSSDIRLSLAVPIHKEISPAIRIGLNILLLTVSYAYFAVFMLPMRGDLGVPSGFRMDRDRGG